MRLVYGVILVTSTLFVCMITYYAFFQPSMENWSAAIIDQLTIKDRLINPAFNASCLSILSSAGFDFKYYPGEDVTVNFYRDLPQKNGKIVVVRAHSAVRDGTNWVDLFTSEIYRDGEYTDLALTKQISKAQMYSYDEWYFAIGPTFADTTMRGQFDKDCLIILMGCHSLNEITMAEALVHSRGAKVVIGWTSWVDANYTDSFTLELLQSLLESGETIKGAVDKLNNKILNYRPNPYNSTLAYYPSSSEVSMYRIPTRNAVSFSIISKGTPQILICAVRAKWWDLGDPHSPSIAGRLIYS